MQSAQVARCTRIGTIMSTINTSAVWDAAPLTSLNLLA